MAASSLVLFFVLGMTGILKVDSYYKVSAFDMRSLSSKYDNLYQNNIRENPMLCNRYNLCNDKTYRKPDNDLLFINRQSTGYLTKYRKPKYRYYNFRFFNDRISDQVKKRNLKHRQIIPSHNYVDLDYSQASSRTNVGSTQHANVIQGHSTGRPNFSTYFPGSSSIDRIRKEIRADNTFLEDGHSVSNLKMIDQKVSDMSSESTKNPVETKSTFISQSMQLTDKSTLETGSKSPSSGGEINLDLIKNKNEFITLSMINKGEKISSFIENNEAKNTSDILTDTFTKSGETNKIYKDKSEDSINQNTFPENLTNTTLSVVLETEGENILESTKTNSPEGLLKTLNNEKFETKSTVLNNNYSIETTENKPLGEKSVFNESSSINHTEIIPHVKELGLSTGLEDRTSTLTQEDRSFDYKTDSSILIHSTNNEDKSTVPQSIIFTTSDDNISSKIKQISLEEIYSKSTPHFKTESTISQTDSTTPQTESIIPQSETVISQTESIISYTTLISDNSKLPTDSSVPFKLKLTTDETVGIKSTSEILIPSSKVISTQSTKTATKDDAKETFSTVSSSETYFPSEGIQQDHIIKIPSIHTARVVITSIFLVIALIAIAVLAVYIFRLKRREIQYDQLRLIP